MHLGQRAVYGNFVLGMLLQQHRLPNATCKDLVLALSTKNNEEKTPIDSIYNKPQLALYKSCFIEHEGRESRKILYKGLGTAAFTALLVGAFAFLSFIALYVAAAVALMGMACTAYKVYNVGKSIDEETKDVRESINSRLSELSANVHINDQVINPQAA